MGSVSGIPKEEVAEILDVSERSVEKMMRKGTLRIVGRTGPFNAPLFDPEEIAALREVREREISLLATTETAEQAWAAARVAQRRVEALERLLGMHVSPAYQLDAESIQALHEEAYQALAKTINGEERVTYWADIFGSLCEQYFLRVASVTNDKEEPWRVYNDLVTHLLRCQNAEDMAYNPAEVLAYRRLNAARKTLRNAIFMYHIQRYGKRAAMRAFEADFAGENHRITMLAIAASKHKGMRSQQ